MRAIAVVLFFAIDQLNRLCERATIILNFSVKLGDSLVDVVNKT
jgi:hypothetical protein